MTPELLELIKQAQPYLPNEWKVGDRCYDTEYDQIGFVVAVIDSNHMYYEGGSKGSLPMIYMKSFDVCLPYPYHHQIWDMIDWSKLSLTVDHGNISVNTYYNNDTPYMYIISNEQDPETALLKVLIWQKENER